MAFTKREYTNGETVITAQNMNEIQDELIRLGTEQQVDSITVQEGQNITITVNKNDGTTDTHVIEKDEENHVTSITVNGREIPVEWVVSGTEVENGS